MHLLDVEITQLELALQTPDLGLGLVGIPILPFAPGRDRLFGLFETVHVSLVRRGSQHSHSGCGSDQYKPPINSIATTNCSPCVLQ